MCAAGEILWPETAPPSLILYPKERMPAVRTAASVRSLSPGLVLGTLYANRSVPHCAFLALQGEASPPYQEGILHPAALLTLSNCLLMQIAC